MVLLELEVEQGGQALRGFQDDVAAVPAVAAVGATVRDVLLPAEAPAPVPAVPGLHVDFDLINEIHGVPILFCRGGPMWPPVSGHPRRDAPTCRGAPARRHPLISTSLAL